MKRQRFLCWAMVIMLLASLPVSFPALANDEPYGYTSRQLVVSGNKVVYQNEPTTAVRLAGVNIPSLDWGSTGENLYESLTEGCDTWNANIIRLPLNPSYWFDTTVGTAYKQKVADMVKGVTARGKYIILDCHTYVMPTTTVRDFWLDVCTVYGNNPAVLFGLCNEPHDISGAGSDAGRSQWDLWRNGGQINMSGSVVTGVGHQQLLEAIRDAGAKNIVIAGGLNWGYDLRGIAGLAGDGINYSLIDQGSGGVTAKTGYGIIYDSHIYPNKGQISNFDTAVGCVRSFAPILIGEFGWDSSDSTVTGNNSSIHNVWMPALLDWIDDVDGKYGGTPANWTAWCFHPSATPRVITGWNYNPTPFLGAYVKARLLSYPTTTAPVTGTYTNSLNPDIFRKYEATKTGTSAQLTNTVTAGKLRITYNRPANATSFYDRMCVPVDWVLSGIQTLEFNLQANTDAVTTNTVLNVGFEGSDQEVWTKQITITNTNNNRIVILVNELQKQGNPKGDGLFTAGIRSIFIGFSSTSKGILDITNLQVTKSANPTISLPAPDYYSPNTPDYNYDMGSAYTTVTVTKNDNGPGSGTGDYFQTSVATGEGFEGSAGIKVDYDRTDGVWGGFSQATFAASPDFSDAKYVSLLIKGNGSAELAQIKLDKGGFDISIPANDTEWHQYIYKLADINVYSPENIKFIEFHAGTKIVGTYWVDNIVFSTERPTYFVEPDEILYENGFEDNLIQWNMIGGSGGTDTMTGLSVDGGYNSQKAYRLTYTRPQGADGKIAEGIFPSWNLGGTTTFVFDAKAETGTTENISVDLLDQTNVAASTDTTFTLTDEWQRFTLDLDDFAINGTDVIPSRIKGIHISNNTSDHSGQIYIDNITFSNLEVAQPAPAVSYSNSFDPDEYTQNGGTWTNIGDDGTAFIRASVETGEGYEGTSGLVLATQGTTTGRKVQMDGGFPEDWAFSRVKYASMMVTCTNVIPADNKIQNTNKFTIEFWNDYVDNNGNTQSIKTGTAYFTASVGSWNNVIVPIEPNTTDSPNATLVNGTNRMIIYSQMAQTGETVIDNLTLSSLKPEEVNPTDPVSYIETFDVNTVFNLVGGYYNSVSDYVFKKENGRQHWGRQLQWIRPANGTPTDPSKNIYISSVLPVSWRLSRTTHFVLDAKLLQPNEWISTDFSTSYGTLSSAVTTATIPVALVDSDGDEFIQEVTITNNSAWQTYQLPLANFVNEDGKDLVLSDIVSVRIYPDPAGGQAGLKMDNIGFQTL